MSVLLHPVGLMLELLGSSTPSPLVRRDLSPSARTNDSSNYSHTHYERIPEAMGWVFSLHCNLPLFFCQLFSLSEELSACAVRMKVLL